MNILKLLHAMAFLSFFIILDSAIYAAGADITFKNTTSDDITLSIVERGTGVLGACKHTNAKNPWKVTVPANGIATLKTDCKIYAVYEGDVPTEGMLWEVKGWWQSPAKGGTLKATLSKDEKNKTIISWEY